MSKTNGRIDYSRLISDIDYANAFEGTRFEEYTDTENGLGSVLGGWLGAILGRFVGMALGQVAQELLVDELFGGGEEAQTDEGTADEAGDTAEEPSDNGEETTEANPE